MKLDAAHLELAASLIHRYGAKGTRIPWARVQADRKRWYRSQAAHILKTLEDAGALKLYKKVDRR